MERSTEESVRQYARRMAATLLGSAEAVLQNIHGDWFWHAHAMQCKLICNNSRFVCPQIGYPCPESMELTPSKTRRSTAAECRCPPGTAQQHDSTYCHKLFEQGPCNIGQYFAPVKESWFEWVTMRKLTEIAQSCVLSVSHRMARPSQF